MRHRRVGPPPFFFEVDFHVLSRLFFSSFFHSFSSISMSDSVSFFSSRSSSMSIEGRTPLCRLVVLHRPSIAVGASDRCFSHRLLCFLASHSLLLRWIHGCAAVFLMFPLIFVDYALSLCLPPIGPCLLGRHHAKSLLGAQIRLNSIAFN